MENRFSFSRLTHIKIEWLLLFCRLFVKALFWRWEFFISRFRPGGIEMEKCREKKPIGKMWIKKSNFIAAPSKNGWKNVKNGFSWNAKLQCEMRCRRILQFCRKTLARCDEMAMKLLTGIKQSAKVQRMSANVENSQFLSKVLRVFNFPLGYTITTREWWKLFIADSLLHFTLPLSGTKAPAHFHLKKDSKVTSY